jgi:DNA-binding NtrC family response regulator
LNTFIIYTPALSAHSEDIPDLISHFLRQIHRKSRWRQISIEPQAVEFLTSRNWPGNVRELRSAVYRASSEARGDCIRLTHVRQACELEPQQARDTVRKSRESLTDLIERAKSGEITDLRARALAETDYFLFTRVIDAANGNKAKAARWLGVTRTTLRQKLKQFRALFERDGNSDSSK